MTTTVEALKTIYVSLGGELTDIYEDIANGIAVGDYVTIPDISNAIAQRAASAGIELPSVSAADNGKLLTVVNGAWNKADAPSGGGLFYIRVNYSSPPNAAPAGLSATFDEIETALNNGLVPIVFDTKSGVVCHLTTAIRTGATANRRFVFVRINVTSSAVTEEAHDITYNGTYNYNNVRYAPTT